MSTPKIIERLEVLECREIKIPNYKLIPNTLNLSASCECADGWMGVFCNTQVTCDDDPCENGGTCTTDSNAAAGYTCTCTATHTGTVCVFKSVSFSF